MRLHIHDHLIDRSPTLARHIERRVHDVLRRGAERVRRILIELSETVDETGAVSKRCFIAVETDDGRTAAVDDTRRCTYAALDSGLDAIRCLVEPAGLLPPVGWSR